MNGKPSAHMTRTVVLRPLARDFQSSGICFHVYLIPVISNLLDVCPEVQLHCMLEPASLPVPLKVPCQSLSVGV